MGRKKVIGAQIVVDWRGEVGASVEGSISRVFGEIVDVWLLNHFNTLVLAVVIVGSVILFAIFGSVMLRRRFHGISEGKHNETVGVLLGVYGAIYGILLAFVVVAEWDGVDIAESVVASEATHAAEIVRGAAAFPSADRDRVIQAVGEYARVVVNNQWPLLKKGMPDSSQSEGALKNIYQMLQGYEPDTASEKAYYEQAVAHLDEVVSERRSRLVIAEQGLPVLLKVLIYGGALIMVSLTFFYGVRNRKAQLMFVGSVAALIGVSLLLTLALDHPFAGDLSITPAPFKQGVLAQFWN
ncbi:hypothetical protein [Streptomyces sp. NPDC059008]|uniref:bestrophin-like domain n=1 Tax=Streptomyces sp. NPDC059008 TaxID=3346693 RepID=UPI003695A489